MANAKKCSSFSNTYLPLLVDMYLKNISEKEIKEFIGKSFEIEVDEINKIAKDAKSIAIHIVPELGLIKPKRNPVRKRKEKSISDSTYVLDTVRRENLLRGFKKEIISKTIFNLENGFINNSRIEPNSKLNILNFEINNYKLSLATQLARFMGEANEVKLNEIESILTKFANTSGIDKQGKDAAYDTYVILRNFDEMLSQNVPFIKRKSMFTEDVFEENMYEYVGPKVNHYKGFSSEESADIGGQTSDLIKILLDYIPAVDVKGNDIPNRSITSNGFNVIMSTIAYDILNDPNLTFLQDKLFSGANANFEEIIRDYVIKKPNRIRLQDELRGIQKYIFNNNSKWDDFYKNTFIAMVLKTTKVEYANYTTDLSTNEFSQINPVEKMMTDTKYSLIDTLRAAIVFENKNVTFNVDSNNYISIISNGIKLSIKANIKGDRYNFSNIIINTINDNKISDDEVDNEVINLFNKVILSELDPEFKNILKSINSNTSVLNTLGQLMGLVALGKNGKFSSGNNPIELLNMNNYLNLFNDISIVESILLGKDNVNVVKDLHGNNHAVYQLTSLSYNFKKLVHNSKGIDGNIYKDTLIGRNLDAVKSPLVRLDVKIDDKIKKSSELTVSEVLRLSILEDFYKNFKKGGLITLQNTTFSDKRTHFLIPYDTENIIVENRTILSELIEKSLKGKDKELKEVIFDTRQKKFNKLVENLIDDFNKVYGNIKSINDIEKKLELKTLDQLQHDFKGNNENKIKVDLYEHIHYTPSPKGYRTGKGIMFPETIKNQYNIYSDFDKFESRFKFEYNNFIELSKDFGLELPESEIKDHNINNVMNTYFLVEALLSNEYNGMLLGETFIHPSKNKDNHYDKDGNLKEYEFYINHEASRLISRDKRAVIAGSTHHPFLQNTKYGVPSILKTAVINDEKGTVFNMIGEQEDGLDTQDGAGWSSVYQAIMENYALMDSPVGLDKKTIMHDSNYRYGQAKLLKWAVYAVTNARRRSSIYSNVKHEHMHNQMHNEKIDKEVVFDYKTLINEFNNGNELFYKSYKTNNYYKIIDIESVGYNSYTRTVIECDSKGNILYGATPITSSPAELNTIYSIDQVLGGAFTMVQEDGKLEYSDVNNYMVVKVIGDTEIKDKMIHYLVNKSAIKVGAGNINKFSNIDGSYKLQTIDVSSKFGGVQMDADHHLTMSVVSEMTQMMSALTQNGFTQDIVNKIYTDVGKTVEESLKEFGHAIESNDNDKVRNLLGKALLDAFSDNEMDTLGLAQSFVKLANKSLQEGNIEYKIPFSDGTINGKFTSTVTSLINKRGIRRKYSGVAGILVPSNNMMQYFTVDGFDYTADGLLDAVENEGLDVKLDEGEFILDVLLNNIKINTSTELNVLNPFIISIDQLSDVEFEDTVVIIDSDGNSTIIKIDNFTKYDDLKNIDLETNKIYRWTIKPKNLKQLDVKFQLNIGNELKTFSIYDLDSVRVHNYIKNYTKSELQKDLNKWSLIKKILPEKLIKSWNESDLDVYLTKHTQNELNNIGDGKAIKASEAFGNINNNEVIPLNVLTKPAQIMMGRMFAKQFGLSKSDTIADIKSQGVEFFLNKLSTKYDDIIGIGEDDVSVMLFDDDGVRYNVIFNKDENIENIEYNQSEVFKTIGDTVYLNEESFDNKNKNIEFLEKGGESYIYLKNPEDLDSLIHNSKFVLRKFNYTKDNLEILNKLRGTKYINVNDANKDVDKNYKLRLENLANDIHTSFWESLKMIGARIPSQTMQSFMAMEVVGFVDTDLNDVYVPKVQTWLQGSDYDIDKLYMLAYSFDNNGNIYSNSNIKTLPFSEVIKLLPPDGRTYSITSEVNGKVENQFEITDQFLNSFKENPVLKLNEIFDYFNYHGSDNKVTLLPININKILEPILYDLKNMLNTHSKTKMRGRRKEEYLKNLATFGILEVINDVKNQINAHNPINMNEQHQVASKSKLGKIEKIVTTDNAAVKFINQAQNMVGSEGIGVCAVGIKVFFGLTSYYNNEVITLDKLIQNEEYDDARVIISKLLFTDKLKQELSANNHNLDFVTLANLNVSILEKYKDHPEVGFEITKLIDITNNIKHDASLSMSGLLSAATDNAKELILSKINATPDLMGYYLYLLSVGKSFAEIAEIMTSDFVNLAVANSKVNIFNKSSYSNSIDKALRLVAGVEGQSIVSYRVMDKLTKSWKSITQSIEWHIFKNGIPESNIIDTAQSINDKLDSLYAEFKGMYNTTSDSNKFDESWQYDEYSYMDMEDNVIEPLTRNELESGMEFIRRLQSVNTSLANMIKDDSKEAWYTFENFVKNVIPASEEMTILGAMFGVNQGLKTNSYEKYAYIKRIERFVENKLDEVGNGARDKYREKQTFDLIRFLSDHNYQKGMIDLYEDVKSTFNILEIITANGSHFAKMFELLKTDEKLINIGSAKNRVMKNILSQIKNRVSNIEYNKIGSFVNNMFILDWLKKNEFSFTVNKGIKYYRNNGLVEAEEDVKLTLSNSNGVASFKYWMDNYVIPELKSNPSLVKNKFISNLRGGIKKVKDKNLLFWRPSLNMMTIDGNMNEKLKYQEQLKGFDELVGSTFEGNNIITLFYLYNLIVNKNSFGQGSFNRFFENIVTESTNSMINDYFEYLSELDHSGAEINVDINNVTKFLENTPDSDFTFGVSNIYDVPELKVKSWDELFNENDKNVIENKYKSFAEKSTWKGTDFMNDSSVNSIIKSIKNNVGNTGGSRKLTESRKQFNLGTKEYRIFTAILSVLYPETKIKNSSNNDIKKIKCTK